MSKSKRIKPLTSHQVEVPPLLHHLYSRLPEQHKELCWRLHDGQYLILLDDATPSNRNPKDVVEGVVVAGGVVCPDDIDAALSRSSYPHHIRTTPPLMNLFKHAYQDHYIMPGMRVLYREINGHTLPFSPFFPTASMARSWDRECQFTFVIVQKRDILLAEGQQPLHLPTIEERLAPNHWEDVVHYDFPTRGYLREIQRGWQPRSQEELLMSHDRLGRPEACSIQQEAGKFSQDKEMNISTLTCVMSRPTDISALDFLKMASLVRDNISLTFRINDAERPPLCLSAFDPIDEAQAYHGLPDDIAHGLRHTPTRVAWRHTPEEPLRIGPEMRMRILIRWASNEAREVFCQLAEQYPQVDLGFLFAGKQGSWR